MSSTDNNNHVASDSPFLVLHRSSTETKRLLGSLTSPAKTTNESTNEDQILLEIVELWMQLQPSTREATLMLASRVCEPDPLFT